MVSWIISWGRVGIGGSNDSEWTFVANRDVCKAIIARPKVADVVKLEMDVPDRQINRIAQHVDDSP